ncbi:notchless protein homolog 1-like [Paramacrobiotus metropolitanus]|uniref:notchless protein homolog 1-like n=1 Tax=Paramacrobiotus metropolitanus TaxID=2943436 RepID=UPI0024461440|nr:notchless protein homolog 1-like [Paramacrobiotus metropolitanus]
MDFISTSPAEMDVEHQEHRKVLAQLKNDQGETLGHPLDIPVDISFRDLQTICNLLLEQQDEPLPYSFFVNGTEIQKNLSDAIDFSVTNTEKCLEIVYQPQAVFRVRAVTRCSSTIEGHAEAIIAAQFSPDGRYLASGSGDTTVRFWDVTTETPQYTCKGHKNWILAIAWSPDGRKLASGCKDGRVCIWDPSNGKQLGKTLSGHQQWITWLCWEPLHSNGHCRLLASSSKDATIRIWDTSMQQVLRILSGHTQSVTCLRWGGVGLLYSCSQDRTLKIWRASDGILVRTLTGHGHWINSMALNTDYVMRTGAFDPRDADVVHSLDTDSAEDLQKKAVKRYDDFRRSVVAERLVSGSDDFTMFLWNIETDKKPLARLTGHQGTINQVCFSPNGYLIASGSFDHSVKLWNGFTGKFITSFRGHVQRVYQIAWSADSRLLVSGSQDSTLKLWEVSTKKLTVDLPGHADDVYAVDWSPDGQRVVSGGKDKVLKIWRK